VLRVVAKRMPTEMLVAKSGAISTRRSTVKGSVGRTSIRKRRKDVIMKIALDPSYSRGHRCIKIPLISTHEKMAIAEFLRKGLSRVVPPKLLAMILVNTVLGRERP